jgi:diguanylate cyclase (GGDEF)-like protein
MLESGDTFAVALLDVDRFKVVNDAYSHAVGDTVLREVATIIQRLLRAGDTVARFGGEEFVVYFPGAAVGSARQACERLRVAIECHDWSRVAHGLVVTVSLGVAGARSGDSADALLGRADAALYVAKRGGRNQVVAADTAALPEA